MADLHEPLTPRERDVLMLAAVHGANDDIAQRLGISAKTVKNHRSRAYEKLGVVNVNQAVALCIGLGEITPEEYLSLCDEFTRERLAQKK